MRRLSFVHRISAVLSSVLLLQLSLLASGTLCRMHGDHAMAAEMAPAAGHMMAHTSATPADGCDMSGNSRSCGTPWAPGGCASMTSCVTAVSAVPAATAALEPLAIPAVQAVASAEMPLGPTFAPELPPPRA